MRLSSVFVSVLLGMWFWACSGESASNVKSSTSKGSSTQACVDEILPGETAADRTKRCANKS